MTLSICYPVPDQWIQAISQVFGVNPDDYKDFGLKGHNGIDIAVPVGTNLKAVKKGIVYKININRDGFGLNIQIKDADGNIYLYAHLSKVLVQVGQQVNQNQVIALSGGAKGDSNSGNSTGPHLHFGLYPVGTSKDNGYEGAVNPLPYMSVCTSNDVPVPVSDQAPIFQAVITNPLGANVRSIPFAFNDRYIIETLNEGDTISVYDLVAPSIFGKISPTEDKFVALIYDGKKKVKYG